MSRRKIHEEEVRSIQSSRGSYYVTLPMALMREFRWQVRQRVVVRKIGKGKILIEDWPARNV